MIGWILISLEFALFGLVMGLAELSPSEWYGWGLLVVLVTTNAMSYLMGVRTTAKAMERLVDEMEYVPLKGITVLDLTWAREDNEREDLAAGHEDPRDVADRTNRGV